MGATVSTEKLDGLVVQVKPPPPLQTIPHLDAPESTAKGASLLPPRPPLEPTIPPNDPYLQQQWYHSLSSCSQDEEPD